MGSHLLLHLPPHSGSLTLIGTFRVFGIIEIFFFSVIPIDFACAVDNFFMTELVFLRFTSN